MKKTKICIVVFLLIVIFYAVNQYKKNKLSEEIIKKQIVYVATDFDQNIQGRILTEKLYASVILERAFIDSVSESKRSRIVNGTYLTTEGECIKVSFEWFKISKTLIYDPKKYHVINKNNC